MFIFQLLTGETSITGKNLRLRFYRWVLERKYPSVKTPTTEELLWRLFSQRSITGFERRVYWASLNGAKGHEIIGKGSEETRPVLIIKDTRATVTVIPLTSQYNGSSYLVPIRVRQRESYDNVRQVRTLDKIRLREFMGLASEADFINIIVTYFIQILCPFNHTP